MGNALQQVAQAAARDALTSDGLRQLIRTIVSDTTRACNALGLNTDSQAACGVLHALSDDLVAELRAVQASLPQA